MMPLQPASVLHGCVGWVQCHAGVLNSPLSGTSQHVAALDGAREEIRTKAFQSAAESDCRKGQALATAGREGLVEGLWPLSHLS